MMTIKKILFRLFLFLLPLIICFSYFEYKLRTQHFVSSYAAKNFFLEQQLSSIETLVLGSSQAFNDIDPSYFADKTFNMANVSQTIFFDKRLTLKYLSQMPRLKTVVVSISYFSFFYQMSDITENWRNTYYNQHFKINCNCQQPLNFADYSMFFLYKPLHSFSLALNNFEDKSSKEILHNGYLPKYIQESINDSLGKQRVLVHNAENYSYRRLEIEKDLEDFVVQLVNKKINVIFITMPAFITYSKYCSKIEIEKNVTFINGLCDKYDCKYYNFFEDTRFVKNDFFDNDHLKNNGAQKLSKILNDTLKQD